MRTRTLVQTLSLLALHSNFIGAWAMKLKGVCNPVLSCHSCALAWFACPIGVFIHYSGYHSFPWIAGGTILLLGVLFGRLLCGWVCPLGFLQDLLHKLPTPKFQLPAWTSYIKYVVLVGTVFAVPWFLGEESTYVFCRYCPSSALQVSLPALIGGGSLSLGTIIKLAITAAVLILVVFASRGFCRLFCPIGALLAPLNYVSFWIVKVPDPECLQCTLCDKDCPTSVVPSKRIDVGIPANRALDCVVCHDCQPACPQLGPAPKTPKRRKRPQLEQA